jgi:hypothetical protein
MIHAAALQQLMKCKRKRSHVVPWVDLKLEWDLFLKLFQ